MTTVNGNAVKVVSYDRGSSRYLVEYEIDAKLLEYPFNVKAGYREWVGPYSVEPTPQC
jgi:hypothetical protein